MRSSNALLAVLAVATLTGACSTPEAAEPKAARPVKTHTVAEAAGQPAIRYSASIEAFEQVPLAFKANGYVTELMRRKGADGRVRSAQPGDVVGAGSVLARVHAADYQERVNQGRARLAEAEASLTKARLDYDRAQTLFASQSLTKPDLDGARANFDASTARVTAARAEIELAASALRDTALVSPSSGIILERRIEVGSLAGAGTVGFVIGDLGAVKAKFGIPDSMIQSVQLGDAIGVIVEAAAATMFEGRVTAIAPAADPKSRVFDVEITIPNRDGHLRPGMIGTVAIGESATSNASAQARPLAVPLTAIVRSHTDGQFAVLTVEGQKGATVAKRRPVELGEVMGNAIAVTKGLDAGQQVVVSGANLLVDGEPIRVLE
jgi:RND family efflux transporter MFP subunit